MDFRHGAAGLWGKTKLITENKDSAGPGRTFLPTWVRPEFLLLAAGVIAIFFACLRPSLGLMLYGDDFCFIWSGRKVLTQDPGLLFDSSLYRDFFRPVLYLTYLVSYLLFGLDGFYYHALLLATHLTVGLMIWRIIILTADPKSRWSETTAVLWFLYFFSHFRIHQAVFWFSGMKQILSALFGLTSVYLLLKMIKGGSRWWFLGVVVLGLLGLFTVESNLGFVIACAAIALFWPRGEDAAGAPRAFALPLMAVVAAYLAVFAATRFATQESHQISVLWKPASVSLSHLWLMFLRSVYPRLLEMDELFGLNKLFVDLFPLWLALSAGVAILVWLKGWPRPAILLGLYVMLAAPYAILFSPVLEGDRIFYESVSALCLFGGYCSVRLIDTVSGPRPGRGAALAAALAVLIFLNLLSYRRVIPFYQKIDHWNKSVSALLYNYFMKNRPTKPVSLYWVGYPYQGERVLATPTCIDKEAELFFKKPVISNIKVGYWRIPTATGQTLFKNRDFVLLEKDDLIIYDNGETIQFMSDRSLGFLDQP